MKVNLMYMQQALSSSSSSRHVTVLVMSILLAARIVKFMALIIITCWKCEQFYISVEETKSACIQRIMDKNCSESVRHLCKRVLHVNRTFRKMTACGLFTIDSSLPIPLTGLLIDQIIIMLQFAFL
ncbi:hypothetical protein PYW08_007815 [Mythimna loreyi]|uniref:Uncharacterized protein n=1 Tax=Mythimna loreyi TaxID=667449 RepID=A0ACC2QDX9_9NEOP|nr:hypothetical protein PYW08_007815 [Mythimna loreyi]